MPCCLGDLPLRFRKENSKDFVHVRGMVLWKYSSCDGTFSFFPVLQTILSFPKVVNLKDVQNCFGSRRRSIASHSLRYRYFISNFIVPLITVLTYYFGGIMWFWNQTSIWDRVLNLGLISTIINIAFQLYWISLLPWIFGWML